MSWKEEKERKTNSFKRKQAELERVRMLHDLFFKKPPLSYCKEPVVVPAQYTRR